MRLNTLKPAPGQKTAPKRLGRGTGSGLGKTCGKGHKGQKARAGGFHKVGFEGGQVPMYRRLPKFGFKSRTRSFVAEIRLHELEKVKDGVITLETLKSSNLIRHDMIDARIIASGEITKAVVIRGLKVTPGAKSAIEKVGGKVEVINE